jgi:hypothetical protein
VADILYRNGLSIHSVVIFYDISKLCVENEIICHCTVLFLMLGRLAMFGSSYTWKDSFRKLLSQKKFNSSITVISWESTAHVCIEIDCDMLVREKQVHPSYLTCQYCSRAAQQVARFL